MFGMGMPEIILILAIALIVLGPKKLPEIAKSLGRGIAEFKKATQDLKQSIEVDNDFKEAKDTLKEIKGDIQKTVHESMAAGAASVDKDNASEEDDDSVSEEDLEHTFEEDVRGAPAEPVADRSQQEEDPGPEQKGPSKDA